MPSQGRITSSILVGVISYKLRIYAVCSFFILFIFELVKEKG
nr:MAG TPA: hypothetical protein [Caudoviricetes sp.]